MHNYACMGVCIADCTFIMKLFQVTTLNVTYACIFNLLISYKT